ncbi:MAG: leucine-rich repeat protein, partial [Clostridia bacterium]|nr:leucine-rich repeat protein [Clostridia bacterium]
SSAEMEIEGLNAVVVSALKKVEKEYVFDDGYSNYGKIIDIAAPGTYIKSAWINSTNGAGAKKYNTIDGTSMASPQVAGAVALLYLNPRLRTGTTAAEIEEMLYEYSLDIGDPGKDIYYGHGLVNLRYFEVKETQTLSFYYNNMIINEYYNYHLFEDSFKLKITCSDSDFSIIYTTDKSIPNIKNCELYNDQLNVSNTVFYYVMGVKIQNGKIIERTELYNISFFYAKTPIEDCFEISADGTVLEYTGKYTKIDMPEYIKGIQVKSLGVSLFKKLNVESVTIPESCKTMAGYVFLECKNLKYVYAPGITKIFISAFYGSAISFVTDDQPSLGATEGCYLPALVDLVGKTFAYCENLTSVKLTKLDFTEEDKGGDFAGCINLTQVNIPKITYIPDSLFSQCPKLETYTINKNVYGMGQQVFAYNKLKNIYVEAGNKYFYCDKNIAVYDSTSLVAFAMGYNGDYEICTTSKINGANKNITRIDDVVLYGCELNSLTIPQTITAIGKNIAANSNIKNVYYN